MGALAPKVFVLTEQDARDLADLRIDHHRVMNDKEYLQFERMLAKRLAIVKYHELAGAKMVDQANRDLITLQSMSVKYAHVVFNKKQIPFREEPGRVSTQPKMIHGEPHQKNRLVDELAKTPVAEASTGIPPFVSTNPILGLDLAAKMQQAGGLAPLIDQIMVYTDPAVVDAYALRIADFKQRAEQGGKSIGLVREALELMGAVPLERTQDRQYLEGLVNELTSTGEKLYNTLSQSKDLQPFVGLTIDYTSATEPEPLRLTFVELARDRQNPEFSVTLTVEGRTSSRFHDFPLEHFRKLPGTIKVALPSVAPPPRK